MRKFSVLPAFIITLLCCASFSRNTVFRQASAKLADGTYDINYVIQKGGR